SFPPATTIPAAEPGERDGRPDPVSVPVAAGSAVCDGTGADGLGVALAEVAEVGTGVGEEPIDPAGVAAAVGFGVDWSGVGVGAGLGVGRGVGEGVGLGVGLGVGR